MRALNESGQVDRVDRSGEAPQVRRQPGGVAPPITLDKVDGALSVEHGGIEVGLAWLPGGRSARVTSGCPSRSANGPVGVGDVASASAEWSAASATEANQ